MALAVVLSMVWVPAGAEDWVYYTAVNDTVLPLNDDSMPFWSSGYLYVSSSMFFGKELGVYYSNNVAKQTVVLYTSRNVLIFDLAEETVADGQGNHYSRPAIVRNGQIFVPIRLIANVFDLSYTNNPVDNGFLIRLKNEEAVLSDSLFMDAASYQLDYRYSQYQKESSPPQTPEKKPEPQEKTTTVNGQTIYLCFKVSDLEQTAGQLDLLEEYGEKGAFFFPANLLLDAGSLLRRMIAGGQAVGLLVDEKELVNTDTLRESNQMLSQKTCTKTRLVWAENADKTGLKMLREAGYCPLTPSLYGTGLYTSKSATNLLQRISARYGSVSVWLGDNVSISGLNHFLILARDAEDSCRALTEFRA